MAGDADRRATAEQHLGAGRYGDGVLDEITDPPGDDTREAKRGDFGDPADLHVDPEVLRNGGPTMTPGMRTTTGGTAGPASIHRPGSNAGNGRVAPTTTGDATSGGMDTAATGSTSDASSGGAIVGRSPDIEP